MYYLLGVWKGLECTIGRDTIKGGICAKDIDTLLDHCCCYYTGFLGEDGGQAGRGGAHGVRYLPQFTLLFSFLLYLFVYYYNPLLVLVCTPT